LALAVKSPESILSILSLDSGRRKAGDASGPVTLVGGGVAERPNALALKARDG
jgi:hypothetical protein